MIIIKIVKGRSKKIEGITDKKNQFEAKIFLLRVFNFLDNCS